MLRFWDFVLFLLPVCLGILLIPGVFSDWWKTHVVPFVGGGLCLGWPILVVVYFKYFKRSLSQD